MKPITTVLIALLLAACAAIAPYDPATSAQLAQLETAMAGFFGHCASHGAHGSAAENTLATLQQQLHQLHQREQQKADNQITTNQLHSLATMLQQTRNRYANQGQLSAGYCTGKWALLQQALHIIHTTEQTKPGGQP